MKCDFCGNNSSSDRLVMRGLCGGEICAECVENMRQLAALFHTQNQSATSNVDEPDKYHNQQYLCRVADGYHGICRIRYVTADSPQKAAEKYCEYEHFEDQAPLGVHVNLEYTKENWLVSVIRSIEFHTVKAEKMPNG